MMKFSGLNEEQTESKSKEITDKLTQENQEIKNQETTIRKQAHMDMKHKVRKKKDTMM